MNIQIFGIKKCFDTHKAERYFMGSLGVKIGTVLCFMPAWYRKQANY